MNKHSTSLLRRKVGGLKKYMYTSGLAFGLMLVPLGYYLVIKEQSIQGQLSGLLSIVAGFTLLTIGGIKAIQEERQAKNKNDKKYNELIEEIRGFRQDLNKRTKQG